MTTNQSFWQPEDRQIRGVVHFREYLRDHLRNVVGDILASFYPSSCVLDEEWPVSHAANLLTVDTTATRRAIVQDSASRSRLLAPTAAAGTEWWDLLAGWAGFDKVYFADVPATPYYIGLQYGTIPCRARQLGEPDVTGQVAPYKFDVYQERIGIEGNPSVKAILVPGTLTFTISAAMVGPVWPAGARPCIVYKKVPVTASAEAVYSGTCFPSAGVVKVTVPHMFGQTQAQATASVAADYTIFVPGPTIYLADPAANPLVVKLGVCNTGVLDLSGQNVVMTPADLTTILQLDDAWIRGYTEGPGGYRLAGAHLGSNAGMAWNNIALTEPGGGVVHANFVTNPLTFSINWFWAGGQFLSQWATDGVDVDPTNYNYSPPVNGTYTVCIIAVDESTSGTPRWTARFSTHAGNGAGAWLAGKVPLVTYVWNAGAIVPPQVVYPLRDIRGDRLLSSAGGQALYLAETGTHGSLALRVEGGAGAGDKGIEQLHLLNDYDDDTAAATIAFERFKTNLDGIDGHVLKVAAQANAANQGNGTEFCAMQLGGASDLDLVGRKVGGVRQAAIANAANPATTEIMVLKETGGDGEDHIPAAGTNHPILLAGDFGFMGTNGKRIYTVIPHRPTRGIVHHDGVAYVNGPWFFGPQGSAFNFEPAIDGVNWLDYVLLTPDDGLGGIDPRTEAWVPMNLVTGDKIVDVLVWLSLDETALAGQVEMTMELIKVSQVGVVTTVGELKAGAGNRWILLATPNGAVAGGRGLIAHGKDIATGNDWSTGAYTQTVDANARWYVRIKAAVWTADPLNVLAGRGALWFGQPYMLVQRNTPWGQF